jgi:hypothetical protein
MFSAAQAFPRVPGIEVVKHSAVASRLGRHFAKTGRWGPEFHQMFLNARRVREIADYRLFEEIMESKCHLNPGTKSGLCPGDRTIIAGFTLNWLIFSTPPPAAWFFLVHCGIFACQNLLASVQPIAKR